MKLLPLVTLAVCALLSACPPPSPSPMPPDAADSAPADVVDASASAPPDSAPLVDATPAADASPDVCARACAQLRALACPEGARANCESACRDDQALGVAAQLHPDCVVDAGTKTALTKCNIRCR